MRPLLFLLLMMAIIFRLFGANPEHPSVGVSLLTTMTSSKWELTFLSLGFEDLDLDGLGTS